MKIQQTAFMLIAVTLFFALVGMFILLIVFSGLRESAALLEQKEALLLVSKLADSPEFACGQAFSGTRLNCIDLDKVAALKDRINTYNGFWGVDGIEVFNSNTGERIEIVPANTGTGVSNFVSLCKKELAEEQGRIINKCEVGRLIVTYGAD